MCIFVKLFYMCSNCLVFVCGLEHAFVIILSLISLYKRSPFTATVSYLYSHLSHEDRREDVVGQCEEEPLLPNKNRRETWLR